MSEKPIFDDLAKIYDSWFLTSSGEKVFEYELSALLSCIGPESGMRMLDVGMGTGIFASEFRRLGVDVEGVDPSPEMRKIAAKRGFIVKEGLGEALPYQDSLFDIVLAMTSIEFAGDRRRFVEEMARVTTPGGIVAIGTLNKWSLFGISRSIKNLLGKTTYSSAHFYSGQELARTMKTLLDDVRITSSVFFGSNPTLFTMRHADSIERVGRLCPYPIGALLVGRGIKKRGEE
jgi:ubiquinone/menaquinone biosynthesis C-methylase UbiE